jgi:hypothetical protein
MKERYHKQRATTHGHFQSVIEERYDWGGQNLIQVEVYIIQVPACVAQDKVFK